SAGAASKAGDPNRGVDIAGCRGGGVRLPGGDLLVLVRNRGSACRVSSSGRRRRLPAWAVAIRILRSDNRGLGNRQASLQMGPACRPGGGGRGGISMR